MMHLSMQNIYSPVPLQVKYRIRFSSNLFSVLKLDSLSGYWPECQATSIHVKPSIHKNHQIVATLHIKGHSAFKTPLQVLLGS